MNIQLYKNVVARPTHPDKFKRDMSCRCIVYTTLGLSHRLVVFSSDTIIVNILF